MKSKKKDSMFSVWKNVDFKWKLKCR